MLRAENCRNKKLSQNKEYENGVIVTFSKTILFRVFPILHFKIHDKSKLISETLITIM